MCIGKKKWAMAVLLMFAASVFCFAEDVNMVQNGGFELDDVKSGVPDFWAVGGDQKFVKQELIRDKGYKGKGFSAKLVCSEFEEKNPSCHAMIYQLNTISLKKDTNYRISFFSKAEGIKSDVIRFTITDMAIWKPAMEVKEFKITDTWEKYEVVLQSKQDVISKNSRLQFWFASTGILWLDNVEVVELEE